MSGTAHIAAGLLLIALSCITIFAAALTVYLFRPEIERTDKIMHFALVGYFVSSLTALPFAIAVAMEWVLK